MLDVASPREKFVVECTSQCDVVVVRREVIDASRHVRRHDEYAVVLLKLQHCGDEATGGGLEEAHAVGKKVTRNEQSHSGIMSRWSRRAHHGVLGGEIGSQSRVADLLESEHVKRETNAPTQHVGELANKPQTDVESGDAQRRGGGGGGEE